MFIDEKCGNFKLVVEGGEHTRNTNKKKKSDILQAYRCIYPVTDILGESISSIIMWNIVNQLG